MSEPELGYLKLRWWEDYVTNMKKENSIREIKYLPILSKLIAEEKLHKNSLLRLIKAREFDCSKSPLKVTNSKSNIFEILRRTFCLWL